MNDLKQISKTAISRAVLGKAAQQPISVYPLALGALGGVAAVVFGGNVITLGLMASGLALGLSGFFGKYVLNKDRYANHYMQNIRNELIKRRQAILSDLEDDLSDVNELSGIKQIALFREKYENLLSILDKKLNPNELTHARYMTIAEQVFLGGLDNLQSVALALKSVSAIDIDNVHKELESVKKRNDQALEQTLRTRKNLYDKQHNRANELLSQNEIALTQLDHVTTKLANIKTEQGHAVMDIDDAMSELSGLIQRADRYDIKQR